MSSLAILERGLTAFAHVAASSGTGSHQYQLHCSVIWHTKLPCIRHPTPQAMTRDYYKLDFMDPSVDTSPIAPALAEFFDDALSSSVSSLNFRAIIDGLGEVLFQFPFRQAALCLETGVAWHPAAGFRPWTPVHSQLQWVQRACLVSSGLQGSLPIPAELA